MRETPPRYGGVKACFYDQTTCNLNLITLQLTAMLRVQITHNLDTFLYWFHIREVCLPGAGLFRKIIRLINLRRAGQTPPKLKLIVS